MQEFDPTVPLKKSLTAKEGAGLVALIAVALRVGMGLVYQPVSFGDSPSYWRAAEAVRNGFVRYDGTRTPGYPIFLAILRTDERVWIAQMALGVVISLLLYYVALKLTGQPSFAVVAGLAHSVNLGQLLFEANLLTETLTTFWIMLTLAGMIYWLLHPEKRSTGLAAGMGFSSSFALMTRPLFIFFPFWILIFLLIERWNLKTLGRSLSFLLPVALIIGSWLGFIHARYGDWSMTTMTGYHLIQHTGGFFELVPDQYSALRDTYLEYRSRHIAEYGTQTNTIWDAIPAMERASGLNFYDLSRTLAQISVRLILDHPLLYLKNVAEGWWLFWRAPVYWSPQAFESPFIVAILERWIFVQRFLLNTANILFIFTSMLAVAMHKRLRLSTNKRLFLWFWIGTIWISSILQTVLDHGDNPRFLVPLQSLVVLWLLWIAWALLQKIPVISLKRIQDNSLNQSFFEDIHTE
jgi:4-amino-4-deoxy-L-arabinose transferase-like glycosyltransferase